ncbi:hypothetical protein CDAR_43101 [Caerostris darwini]|uniref:Uncharacterized protein n=1 Tax=Caerostris darwini TaxID=1538125 RepID=A0AAV4WGE6_9ARAC|nr:hypothetical protein CDAR_43101 [Caerostris darwini]
MGISQSHAFCMRVHGSVGSEETRHVVAMATFSLLNEGGEKCFYGDRVDKSHLLANGYSHHVAAAQAAVVAATAGAPPHLNPLPFMALNHAAAAAAHHNSMMSGTLPLAASSSHGHLNSSSSSGRGPESSSVIKERNSHTSDVINSTR